MPKRKRPLQKRINHKRSNRHLEPLVMPLAFVKITKARFNTYWYRKEIGKYFFVAKDINDDGKLNRDDWQVVEQNFDGSWRMSMYVIDKRDCEVILQAV